MELVKEESVKKLNRKIYIDTAIVCFLLLSLLLLFKIYYVAKSEGTQCFVNPLQYASKKLSEANKAEFRGTGSFLSPNSPIIEFDQYNVTVKTIESNRESFIVKNFTDLINSIHLSDK